MTTDEPALLAAIFAAPGDDLPRLVYADWLDENARLCPSCDGGWYTPAGLEPGRLTEARCGRCNGTGTDARRERAEFIRVQCELAKIGPPRKVLKLWDEAGQSVRRHGDGYYETNCVESSCGFIAGDRVDLLAHIPLKKSRWLKGLKVVKFIGQDDSYTASVILKKDGYRPPANEDDLRRRERELFTFHNIEKWFRKPEATFDRHTTDRAEFDRLSRETAPTTGISIALVRRGFIAEVTGSAEAWLGGECRRCRESYGHPGKIPQPRRDMTQANVIWRICPECKGDRRTPGLAESLYWRPGATVACPRCAGCGIDPYITMTMTYDPNSIGPPTIKESGQEHCKQCSGKKRIPRPMPPTAQPIERVNLTTFSDDLDEFGVMRHWMTSDSFTCDRFPGVDFHFEATDHG